MEIDSRFQLITWPAFLSWEKAKRSNLMCRRNPLPESACRAGGIALAEQFAYSPGQFISARKHKHRTWTFWIDIGT